MGRMKVKKAPRWSQLNKTDTGALKRNDPTRMRPVERPHMARHGTPDRTMPHGSKWKMGCSNVHNAPGWSQLRKNDTGTLK